MKRTLVGVLIAWLVFGCSTDRPQEEFFAPGDVGTLVVDGVLIVGRPLPSIVLTRTSTPDKPFDPVASAERNATLSVFKQPIGPLVVYEETPTAGVYKPALVQLEVEPGTRYDLRVTTSKGETVTARTTTPERFAVSEWLLLNNEGTAVRRRLKTYEEIGEGVYSAPENQLVYTDGLLESRFDRTEAAGFQVGISSLDPESDFVIDPAFFEEEDFENFERDISSPAFEAGDDKVRLPWFAIFFQGRYKIKVYAVDTNWYELILTLPEFNGGGGGETGENFSRPSFNVDGGIGLFGSASVDSIGFFILPRP